MNNIAFELILICYVKKVNKTKVFLVYRLHSTVSDERCAGAPQQVAWLVMCTKLFQLKAST